jgi:DNA-binding NarL/FixJ family response regulator
MEKVKVFLSDPQILFREGIHFILSGEDDFEVTGETTSNEDAFKLIEANPPNIAILSMRNGKFTGPQITRRIRRILPSVAVILISESDDEEQLFLAIKSGASACINKDVDPEFLLDIIRVVAQGSQPVIEDLLIPGIASRVLVGFDDISTLNEQLDNLLADLTTKEREILSNIGAGNSIDEIAENLDIKEETIRRNLRLILNKLVANDHARGVIEAAQRSLPSIIHGGTGAGDAAANYVSKTEFDEFKSSLMEQLKSILGEKS